MTNPINSDVADLINGIREDGLSSTTNRFYAIYRATVVSNQDPENLGRIQIKCGATQGMPSTWVKPSFMGAGVGRGWFFIPEAEDTVFVAFYEGDPQKPEVYFGGWYGQVGSGASASSTATTTTPTTSTSGPSDVPTFLQPPSSGYPEKKGIVTRAGHALIFNDEAGKESLTLLWNQPATGDPALTDRTQTAAYNKGSAAPSPAFSGQMVGSTILSMDATGVLLKSPSSFILHIDETVGALTIAAPNGSMFSINSDGDTQMLNKSGSSVSLSASGINISAAVTAGQVVNVSGTTVSINGGAVNLGGQATDFAVLGLKLIAWLAAHTHPYSFGVTLPPVPPPTPANFCSQTVKVQM